MDFVTIILIVLLICLLLTVVLLITFLVIKIQKQKLMTNNSQKELILIDEKTHKKQRKQIKEYYDELKKEFQEDFENYKNNTLITALENVTYNKLDFKTFVSVACPNEDIKKKIIGKNARNRRKIENLIGIDLQIEPNLPIKISSLNPFNREIGRRLIEKLVNADYIDEPKIEKNYDRVVNEFDDALYKIGDEIVNDVLYFNNINKGLYKYIGRLKYRLSYGQSILMHSIECAQLAYSIAEELNLDKQLAAQCAFFHDLGKSVDLDMDKGHVQLGVELAEKYSLNPIVILAIKSHHNDIVVDNIYCALVKIVDKLSASRLAARNQKVDDYIKRAVEFEKICKSCSYVKQAYVLKSCHEIRVIVNSKKEDIPLEIIAQEIKEKIQNSNEYNPNFNIKVILTKESFYEINI